MKEIKVPNINKVEIGSSLYDVKYVDRIRDEQGKELAGRIWLVRHLIHIDKNVSYQCMLQVIHHESTHGIMWEYAIEDVKDLDLVTPISNGMYAFIVNNPEYIREILKYTERIKK